MRYLLCFFIVLATLLNNSTGHAQQPVVVAAYEYPPFYSETMSSHVIGDILTRLNEIQTDYFFSLQQVPVAGRYRAMMDEGCCDLMLYEAKEWGWEALPVQIGEPTLNGSERFVWVKNREGLVIQSLDELQLKHKIGGIIGYHYPFLKQNEQMKAMLYLTDTHMTNLRLLKGERIDYAVINDHFVRYLMANGQFDEFDISKFTENDYLLRYVVNPQKGITIDAFSKLWKELEQSGALVEIYQHHQVAEFALNQ